ncbi:hypothetical protein [Chryseobacterium sp. JK1]|uniref:hypothetical protein n=1 Tax=Chryseobacterium sp. JK1 TaxID=874294 RepID=UPI003D692F6A
MRTYLLLIFCTLSINLFSQQNNNVTWKDILLDRSIESLHKTLNESKEDEERELFENNLLILDNGYLIDNKYFDTYTTKKIKERNLGHNMLYNSKEFSKIFSYLKVNKLSFIKATVKNTYWKSDQKYYIFFETMSAIKTPSDITFKNYNTALYVYKWNDSLNNGDYELEKYELFNR